MKKAISMLLLLCTLAVPLCSAMAASPEYKTTQSFLDALDDEDFKYIFGGTDSDKDEVVTFMNTDDTYGDKTFRFYFDEDEDSVSIRVWNVVDFDLKDRDRIEDACMSANSTYKFARFYIDDSDNSVTMACDCFLPTRNSGDITLQTLFILHEILQDCYESFTPGVSQQKL